MKKLLTLALICFSFYQVNAQQQYSTTEPLSQEVKSADEIYNLNGTFRKRSVDVIDDRLILSPNPVLEGVLFVQFVAPPDVTARLTIIDSFGAQVFLMNINSLGKQKHTIDVSNLSKGMYIVVVEAASMTLWKKFIIQ